MDTDRNGPRIRGVLSAEAVEAPLTPEEAYQGSLRALLARNAGRTASVTFLTGQTGRATRTGALTDAGYGCAALFRQGRLFAADADALRYAVFYGARRR